jgi:Flp pilus assembly protein TadD
VTGWLQVVREEPGNAGAWVELGNAYSRRGRNDAAETALRTAVEIDPGHSGAWNNLGSVHLQTGRDEEALEAFERAVAVDKSNAVAYYNLGIALERADRLEEALDSYEHALVLDPDLRLPSENPNIVNNRHLMVLLLRLYQRGGGSTVLSLQPGEEQGVDDR